MNDDLTDEFIQRLAFLEEWARFRDHQVPCTVYGSGFGNMDGIRSKSALAKPAIISFFQNFGEEQLKEVQSLLRKLRQL